MTIVRPNALSYAPAVDEGRMRNPLVQLAQNRPAGQVTYGPFGDRYEIEQMAPPDLDPVMMMLRGRFGALGRMTQPPPRGPWNDGARYAEEVRNAAELERLAHTLTTAMARRVDGVIDSAAPRLADVPLAGFAGYSAHRAARSAADAIWPRREDDGIPVLPGHPY